MKKWKREEDIKDYFQKIPKTILDMTTKEIIFIPLFKATSTESFHKGD